MGKNHFHSLCLVCVCAMAATVYTRPTLGQQPIEAVKFDEHDRVMQVYHLEYVKAEEASRTIAALFGDSSDLTLSVDERINALLVRADNDMLGEIAALLKVLDSQQPQSQTVKTLPLKRESSNSVLQALRAFNLSSVEMGMTAEGGLILRGSQKDVAIAEELIKQIGAAQGDAQKDISIQLIWLTERFAQQSAVFQGRVADQLTARGFEPLSILSELEVTTVAGGRCEASGAAGLGDINSQVQTRQEGERIVLELDVDARYLGADEAETRISFSTELTTPLNRWVVFGVAQRQAPPEAEAGQAKDVFLIRVNEQTPLDP